MSDKERFYVFSGSEHIIEYPAKIVHSPWCCIGEDNRSIAREEHVLIGEDVFRLHSAIAKPAIEAWRLFMEERNEQ